MNHQNTTHYLPQPQSGHTFSAKEKDDETGYSYFGARYYDSELSVWLSVDKKSDKGPWISPYAYCFNNPVKMVDPDGKWPKWIHNRIIRLAFEGTMTKEEIKTLQKASVYTDTKPGSQLPSSANEHGMSIPGQSKTEAEKGTDEFIESKDNAYIETGDLKTFGEGGHAIMDKTSPSHENYQVWNGTSGVKNIIKGLSHFVKELNLFRLNDDKVKQAAQDYKSNYDKVQTIRNQRADQQANDRVNNGSGMGGMEQYKKNEIIE